MLWWLNRRATAQPSSQPISRVLATVSPDAITTILLSAAGVLLLAGVYVVIPAVIAAIAGGVASAWLFLIRIAP